ncbi:hypothetical protein AB4Z10_00015 [Bosea sp. RAF48]|uniref:hypothetical protein n=1 Tax=Bosea sp. RAF48 TaxID=3237480 RepID=UPI003F8DF218
MLDMGGPPFFADEDHVALKGFAKGRKARLTGCGFSLDCHVGSDAVGVLARVNVDNPTPMRRFV